MVYKIYISTLIIISQIFILNTAIANAVFFKTEFFNSKAELLKDKSLTQYEKSLIKSGMKLEDRLSVAANNAKKAHDLYSDINKQYPEVYKMYDKVKVDVDKKRDDLNRDVNDYNQKINKPNRSAKDNSSNEKLLAQINRKREVFKRANDLLKKISRATYDLRDSWGKYEQSSEEYKKLREQHLTLEQTYSLANNDQKSFDRRFIRDLSENRFRATKSLEELDKIEIFTSASDDQNLFGFRVKNIGSPKINPRGAIKKDAHRNYDFIFTDNSVDKSMLEITDIPFEGRASHTTMTTDFFIYPKKNLPSLKVIDSGNIEVVLENGEKVLFDKETHEIVGGVLNEAPIDYNKSRHARSNPIINYTGKGLVIKSQQRGDDSRAQVVWGSVLGSPAVIQYPSRYKKSCKVARKDLWKQNVDTGAGPKELHFLFEDDYKFFEFVEKKCGWDLSDLKSSAADIARDNEIKQIRARVAQKEKIRLEQELSKKKKAYRSPKLALRHSMVKSQECIDILGVYFTDQDDKEKVSNYLQVQSKLALHRIAWSYLKLAKKSTKNIENKIVDLLKKRDPVMHERFLNSPKMITKNELLLETAGTLKNSVLKEFSSSDKVNHIKYGDIKILDLLVNSEKIYGGGAKNGVVSFLTSIQNSDLNQLKKIINDLVKNSNKVGEGLSEIVMADSCEIEMEDQIVCNQFTGCEEDSISQVLNSNEHIL